MYLVPVSVIFAKEERERKKKRFKRGKSVSPSRAINLYIPTEMRNHKEQPFFRKVRLVRSRSIYARRSTTYAETYDGRAGGARNERGMTSERG